MNTNDPFNTFQKSAFRLEALPQYIVEDEADAFEAFKTSGTLPKTFGTEWADLVKRNVDSGKKMDRLRLVSDELSSYEQFELQLYSGIQYGEEIRIGARSLYLKRYLYDFWFFDDEYIAQMH